jgi:hypothetical protein
MDWIGFETCTSVAIRHLECKTLFFFGYFLTHSLFRSILYNCIYVVILNLSLAGNTGTFASSY